MSKTTLDYDPFLCDECSKYGYCIKNNKQKENMRIENDQNEQIKIINKALIQLEYEEECLA